jgi:glycosyltransferase involved in cell wall biosynthesis
MRTAVFSIISPNYRHYARVLMSSVREQHPDWDRFVLLVGGDVALNDDESFTTIPLDALPLPNPRQFAFRYTILELNTAVKPWMFAHLFARGYDRVVYFDPDIFLFSPLAELDSSFITLTPHLTGRISGDEHPSERTILIAGTYNLGFLAVSRHPQLDRFLNWWQEKLEYQCVVDTARGLFVDQKWMDLVPGLFPDVRILRHDGYNVAYWNLEHRSIAAATNGERTVNGEPLRFYHFSGFDPAMPDVLSRHQEGRTLNDDDDVRALADRYRAALLAADSEAFRGARYAFATFADGTRIPEAARVAWRNSSELQAAAGDDPFAHSELFISYRDATPRSMVGAKAALASYRLLSRARPLVVLFPRSLRTKLREFLLGRKELPTEAVRDSSSLPPGLNIVGYVRRDTGVGESARLCVRACEAIGLPTHVVDIDVAGAQADYRASIFHVNADQVPQVHANDPQLFDDSSYNIGCWHWEMPELPDAWISSAAPLDEIWAPSSFVQSAVSRKVTIPVVHMPHGIEVTELEPCSPQELGVPEGRFTFLCMFDLDSVMERKNPFGAIEAFSRAFAQQSNVALLVKAGRAATHPAEYAALQKRTRELPNVFLTDRMLSRAQTNGLIAACDSVVSLHRSEGFGLILAEAMYLGKPVIATGWSGNMDFMNSGNSCPVGYELVTLDETNHYYQAGEQWAEPDLGHAAELMRRVVDDAAWRTQLGENARNTMRTRFSPAAAGARYQRRLAFLGLMNR